MITVLSCIALAHDLRFVGMAALVCIAGSIIAMRLLSRVRRTQGGRQFAWLFLASFLAGGTIWTTHFVAMLGFEMPIEHGYDPLLTFVSLFVAIAATFTGFLITARAGSSVFVEIGGAVLGLGIAAMHYTGMAAYRVAGTISWDMTFVVASLILGALFGAIAMNRMARPVTRFCRHGASAALILAICSMHFTGMSAMTVTPGAGVLGDDAIIATGILTLGVFSIMLMVLGTGASIHFIDVQSQNEAVSRYRHLALHDPLTSLPNRAHLQATLEDRIETQTDRTARIAVFAFDLNRFKPVNDVHGHAAGDTVLRELAARLSKDLSKEEFVARVGGDEFIALKTGIFTRSDALAFAHRIMNDVEAPFEHAGALLSIGASIGIAIYPGDGKAPEDLISRADLAMYRAKSTDSGAICFYEKSMDESSRSRSALAMDLRKALEQKQFELYFQAQNDTGSQKLLGFEALLRWNHPERGMISPAEFIPIAEQSGLICEIGEWVIREACREAAGWPEAFRIAVNVAPLQLAQETLPSIVDSALRDAGLEPARLELEITESGIIADQTHALQIVRQLKGLGVRIAMDDYGTGYSSLATLKSFPFDKIKIDRSFVDGVTSDKQSAAIVRATIILGNSLDIPVLAEGVETAAHLDFLNSLGCNEVQGYYFGRPMPKTRLAAYMLNSDVAKMHDRANGADVVLLADHKVA